MVNSNLEKVYRENLKGHNIFEKQTSSDMKEFKELLEKENQIVIDFPQEEWNTAKKLIFLEDPYHEIDVARQFVAAKILSALTKKYPQLEKYDAESRLDIFKTNKEHVFWEKCKTLYSLDNVMEILEIEDIKPDRIHFIMNGNNSNILCDALSILLRDNNQFNTSIYTSPNIFYTSVVPDSNRTQFLNQAYNYTLFHRSELGEVNQREKTYEKV